jgi:hypothetical protein
MSRCVRGCVAWSRSHEQGRRREPAFVVLTALAAATYPALALAWCVAVLLVGTLSGGEMPDGGPFLIAATVVLVSIATTSVVSALRAAIRAVRETRAFHRCVASSEIPIPAGVVDVVVGLGLAGRVRVVDVREPWAVTAGLRRPYVVISTELVASLAAPQLRAVLAHERAHLTRRDPLRIVVGRVLAAHLWFMPVARDIRDRSERGCELAADRAATRRCGRSALAGALLSVLPLSTGELAGAAFSGSGVLAARIAQLELGYPPDPERIPLVRSAATVFAVIGFVVATAGAWVYMVIACACCGVNMVV